MTKTAYQVREEVARRLTEIQEDMMAGCFPAGLPEFAQSLLRENCQETGHVAEPSGPLGTMQCGYCKETLHAPVLKVEVAS